MTTDEKIEEVLKIVREEREFMREEREFMRDERALNNSRFTQLSTGFMDVRKEVGEVKGEMTKMNLDLNAKIDKVYDSLSQDIQIFAQDLHHVKKRVTKLEKHFAS